MPGDVAGVPGGVAGAGGGAGPAPSRPRCERSPGVTSLPLARGQPRTAPKRGGIGPGTAGGLGAGLGRLREGLGRAREGLGRLREGFGRARGGFWVDLGWIWAGFRV